MREREKARLIARMRVCERETDRQREIHVPHFNVHPRLLENLVCLALSFQVVGKADMAVTSLKITTERSQAIDFSIPILETGITIVVLIK